MAVKKKKTGVDNAALRYPNNSFYPNCAWSTWEFAEIKRLKYNAFIAGVKWARKQMEEDKSAIT